MPNYSKSKIYKLYSLHDPSKIYIGSTVQSLAKRKGGHKSAYKCFLKGNLPSITSFQIIELGEVKIELIEEVVCDNKEQLHKIEAGYIRDFDCVNKVIPCRTNKQYQIDNKEAIKKRMHQYRIDNRAKIKQYRIAGEERIKQRMKQYRIDNKEKIKEQNKKYYIDNKENIKEQRKQYRKKKQAELLCHNIVAPTALAKIK